MNFHTLFTGMNLLALVSLGIYTTVLQDHQSAKIDTIQTSLSGIQIELQNSQKNIALLKSAVEAKVPDPVQADTAREITLPTPPKNTKKDYTAIFSLTYSKEDKVVTCENCEGDLDAQYDLTWVVENQAGVSFLEKNAEGGGNRLGKKTISCDGYIGPGPYIYLKTFIGDGYTRISNVIECNK